MSIAGLTEREADRFIRRTPVSFVTAKKIIELCDNPQTQACHLYRLICTDPILFSLTCNLHRYFYPRSPEDQYQSIAKIIIMLNPNTVKNYLLEFAREALFILKNDQNIAEKQEKQKELWLKSHTAAIASRFLARERRIESVKLEEYYAAGLVHNMGEYFEPDSGSGITAVFAKINGYNTSLSDVIRFHHDYQNYHGEWVDIVFNVVYANYLVRKAGIAVHGNGRGAGPEIQPSLDKKNFVDFNIYEDMSGLLHKTVQNEIESSKKFLTGCTE